MIAIGLKDLIQSHDTKHSQVIIDHDMFGRT